MLVGAAEKLEPLTHRWREYRTALTTLKSVWQLLSQNMPLAAAIAHLVRDPRDTKM